MRLKKITSTDDIKRIQNLIKGDDMRIEGRPVDIEYIITTSDKTKINKLKLEGFTPE